MKDIKLSEVKKECTEHETTRFGGCDCGGCSHWVLDDWGDWGCEVTGYPNGEKPSRWDIDEKDGDEE